MMHTNVLPGTIATALKRIAATHLLDRAYLAGGTAAALQLGHRVSRDLDFFTDAPFDEKAFTPLLEGEGLRDVELDRQTVLGRLDGVDFSYFHYKYPLLGEAHSFEGILVADLIDIAAMKIDAIATRGIRRDFIDLFAIMRERRLSLSDVLALYQKKYGMQRDMLVHSLRSLAYFDDAETQDPDERPLELLQPIDWEDVKRFFRSAVEGTSKALLRDS